MTSMLPVGCEVDYILWQSHTQLLCKHLHSQTRRIDGRLTCSPRFGGWWRLLFCTIGLAGVLLLQVHLPQRHLHLKGRGRQQLASLLSRHLLLPLALCLLQENASRHSHWAVAVGIFPLPRESRNTHPSKGRIALSNGLFLAGLLD